MSVSTAMYVGATGLNTYSNAMRVVSDNLANANTTAFKCNEVRFGDMVAGYMPITSEDNDRMGAGVSILGSFEDFAQGSLVSSTNWSDMAIEGEGFYEISETNDGQNTNAVYYTRDGSFHMDKEGYLVNNSGYNVLNTSGDSIKLLDYPDDPEYNNFYVDGTGQIYGTRVRTLYITDVDGAVPDGQPSSVEGDWDSHISFDLLTDFETPTDPNAPNPISVNIYDSNGKLVATQTLDPTSNPWTWDGKPSDDSASTDVYDATQTYTFKFSTSKDGQAEPIENGKLQLVLFANRDGLIRHGGNMYATGPTSGDPITSGESWEKTIGKIVGYNLESSNVDIAKEMVNMIVYQATYNANSKSITTSSDMLNTVVNLIR